MAAALQISAHSSVSRGFCLGSHGHGINQIKLDSPTPKLICRDLLRKENRFESETVGAEHVPAALQALLLAGG